MQFLRSPSPRAVQANFSYGFSADIGGGPYQRALAVPEKGDWWAFVSQAFSNPPPEPRSGEDSLPEKFSSLQEALDAWAEYLEGLPPECYPPLSQAPPRGIILIVDSESYAGPFQAHFPKQSRLVIEAETGQFPTLLGGLAVKADESAQLSLNGLRISRTVRLEGPITLRVEHCTLNPPIGGRLHGPALEACTQGAGPFSATIARSILGPIRLPSDGGSLSLVGSIVDAVGRVAVSGEEEEFGPATIFERVTVFGSTRVERLPLASESIFMEPIRVRDVDSGCVRFSYVPLGSRTPPRFSCQPDLVLEEVGDSQRETVLLQVRPTFTSRHYADGGYAQLSLDASPLILNGAEDDGQMGAFNIVHQEIREALLQDIFKEYVPLGLDPQIFFAT